MWRSKKWVTYNVDGTASQRTLSPDKVDEIRKYLQEQEEKLSYSMRQEMRILRPDFGLASLIDWDKTAMDTVEGRE